MGLYSGSVSYVRYKIKGNIHKDIKNMSLEKLKEFSFKEIDPISLKEKSMGWVSAENMASSFFDDLHFAKEPYFVFSMRIDVRRIPSLSMKAALLREEIKYKKTTGQEVIKKKDRDMLKDEVWQQLMKRTLPAPSLYDVCWNVSTGIVLFFSNSVKANEEFVGLFCRTFDVRIFPISPNELAGSFAKSEHKTSGVNFKTINFING